MTLQSPAWGASIGCLFPFPSLFNIIFTETPPALGFKRFLRRNLNRKCEFNWFLRKSITVNSVYTKLNASCWTIQVKHLARSRNCLGVALFHFLGYYQSCLNYYLVSGIMTLLTCHLNSELWKKFAPLSNGGSHGHYPLSSWAHCFLWWSPGEWWHWWHISSRLENVLN